MKEHYEVITQVKTLCKKIHDYLERLKYYNREPRLPKIFTYSITFTGNPNKLFGQL